MPEIPQLKKFPYQTEKRCPICHPADSAEPPFYECAAERPYAGTQVLRELRCPNCSSTDTDIMDSRTGRVTFDHSMDIRGARGVRSGDVG